MCPPNVPAHPERTYEGGGWQGWGHWLGTGNRSNKAKNAQFLPLGEALRVARQLRLVSEKEWRLWCRSGARPVNVPANPHRVSVHDGWFGWEHWIYHANLGPATVPAVDSSARKWAAPGRANTPGNGSGKRQAASGAEVKHMAEPRAACWLDETVANISAAATPRQRGRALLLLDSTKKRMHVPAQKLVRCRREK